MVGRRRQSCDFEVCFLLHRSIILKSRFSCVSWGLFLNRASRKASRLTRLYGVHILENNRDVMLRRRDDVR